MERIMKTSNMGFTDEEMPRTCGTCDNFVRAKGSDHLGICSEIYFEDECADYAFAAVLDTRFCDNPSLYKPSTDMQGGTLTIRDDCGAPEAIECDGMRYVPERTCAIEANHGAHGSEPRFDGDVWTMYYVCSECHLPVSPQDCYCRHCGRRVVSE